MAAGQSVLPGQSVPPLDSNGNFNLTWWLYFSSQLALFNALSATVAAASGGASTAAGTPGYTSLAIASNQVTLDLSFGLTPPASALSWNFLLTLNQAEQVTVENPFWTGGLIVAGQKMSLYIVQDAIGARPTPAWGAAFGADIKNEVLDGTPATRSAYSMTFHTDSLWHLDSFTTGQPLT